MRIAKLLAVSIGLAAVLALGAAPAGAASRASLELKSEGKALSPGGEVLLVAGYSMNECFWEETEFKVSVNNSSTDKLVRTGQPGLAEGCAGGAKQIEITGARKMVVKMAPLRIHVGGPCVYEFREFTSTYQQKSWGLEISGNATGKLYKPESPHAGCTKTRGTIFDMALSGVETALS